MTTDEVLDALGRYIKDSNESDRQTATKLRLNCLVLEDFLSRKTALKEARWPDSRAS